MPPMVTGSPVTVQRQLSTLVSLEPIFTGQRRACKELTDGTTAHRVGDAAAGRSAGAAVDGTGAGDPAVLGAGEDLGRMIVPLFDFEFAGDEADALGVDRFVGLDGCGVALLRSDGAGEGQDLKGKKGQSEEVGELHFEG